MWALISAFFFESNYCKVCWFLKSLWEKLQFQYILATNYEGTKIHTRKKVRNKNLIECHKNWADNKMHYLQLQYNTVKNLFSFMYFLNQIFPNPKTHVIAMIYKTTLILASLKSMYSETATKFRKKSQCFDVYLVKTLWVIFSNFVALSDNLDLGKCNCHRLVYHYFFKPMK